MKSPFLKTLLLVYICLTSFNISKAQNNSSFNILIGANISNPNQLFEGNSSPSDFNNDLKSWGNLHISVMYKNRFQLGFGQELNEYSLVSKYPKDFYIFGRFYFLKDTAKVKPYIEANYILNTYGGSIYKIKDQLSFGYGVGIIYKLNKIVSLDIGLGMQYRDIELEKDISANSSTKIEINRLMFKTGLLFKVF